MSSPARHAAKILALLIPLSSASGATITVTSFDGTRSNPFTTNEGSLLAFGSIAIGTFTISDQEIVAAAAAWDLARLQRGFVQFGNAIGFGFNDFPGLYQNTVTAAIPFDGPLAGKPIYTVVGDGFTLRSSFGLIIYKHTHSFHPDPEPTAPAVLSAASGGELIVGEYGKFHKTIGLIVDAPTFSLAVKGSIIPEPSVAALVVLSGCSGLVRRRQDRRPTLR